MAYYLVEAAAKEERLPELAERLEKDEFLSMRPFGVSVTFSLRGARRRPDGGVVWEEEDYCSPPLAQERAAVLDEYFDRPSQGGRLTEPMLCRIGHAYEQATAWHLSHPDV